MKYILVKAVTGAVAVGMFAMAPLVWAQEDPGASMCIARDERLGGAVKMDAPAHWLKGVVRMSPSGPVFVPVPDGWMPAMIPDPTGGAYAAFLTAQSHDFPYVRPLIMQNGAWVFGMSDGWFTPLP